MYSRRFADSFTEVRDLTRSQVSTSFWVCRDLKTKNILMTKAGAAKIGGEVPGQDETKAREISCLTSDLYLLLLAPWVVCSLIARMIATASEPHSFAQSKPRCCLSNIFTQICWHPSMHDSSGGRFPPAYSIAESAAAMPEW